MAVYLITGQSNRIGLFPFSPAMAAEAMKMGTATFQRVFKKTVEILGWKFDAQARVLWIPTWWKYNEPQNKKHLIGCLRDLEDVPATPLIKAFLEEKRYLSNTYADEVFDRYGHSYENPDSYLDGRIARKLTHPTLRK